MSHRNRQELLSGNKLLIFGHRGACGYLPENTLESFDLAFQQGSDAIEFDVVLTSDSVPIIRHDDDLTLTTNIAGHSLGSVFAHELSWQEICSLRAIERYPNRNESKLHDGLYSIPSLEQLLSDYRFNNKHLILEIKYGKFLRSQNFDPIAAIHKVLSKSDWKSKGISITVESFEFETLRNARDVFGSDFKYFFLSSPETLPQGKAQLDRELISEISGEFDGLSVALSMLFDSKCLEIAKEFKLPVYAYTARVETAQGDWRSWFEMLANSGIAGVFADQPDLMIQVVRPNA